MRLDSIRVRHFKRVNDLQANLDGLNVLVGGNNSGKSSFLQGIHFAVIAAVTSRQAERDTFTQDSLLYCPSSDFTSLRHGGAYANQSNYGYVNFVATSPENETHEYEVKIYRGRNEGNVGINRSGSPRLGTLITADAKLFSIYVPGLAGISQNEQFRSESVVRRGVASGDANLYLRNVLHLIYLKDRLRILIDRVQLVFPQFNIRVSFKPAHDVNINVEVSTTGPHGRYCPIELAGTGLLQTLQIFSYITLFEPRLLLLDEPDSHLHPDNQAALARALVVASRDISTQIIVSTHSRHLVDALYDDANFVWITEGRLHQQGMMLPRLPMLLELGALDGMDRMAGGQVDWLILSEDTDLTPIKILFESSGYNLARCKFISYQTSSKFESAISLAKFIRESYPATRVIIHRDGDFMTAKEANYVAQKAERADAIPFITEGSDVESYFCNVSHISHVLQAPIDDVALWIETIATDKHAELQHLFTRKRDEIDQNLIRKSNGALPQVDTMRLIGEQIPMPVANRFGKKMLPYINGRMHQRFGRGANLLVPSENCVSDRLKEILTQ